MANQLYKTFKKWIKDALEPILEGLIHIQHPLSEFSIMHPFDLDSTIIKKKSDYALLRSWITPSNTLVKGKLLYRATRDGFSAAKFHKRCDNHPNTLTIIKSNTERVFGGFSDQTWKPTEIHKHSTKTWLFSLDEKEKYPIKAGLKPNSYCYCCT